MTMHRHLVLAAVVTLPGLGGLGLGLMYFFHPDEIARLTSVSGQELGFQLILGTGFAAVSLAALLGVLKLALLKPVVSFFAQLLTQYAISAPVILILSLCAGVGEELLFRGAIQPWLGIWFTAFIFILLHGYLNPLNRPLMFYGTILLVVSAGFGYLCLHTGLYAAMTAHTVIDIALMMHLRKVAKQS